MIMLNFMCCVVSYKKPLIVITIIMCQGQIFAIYAMMGQRSCVPDGKIIFIIFVSFDEAMRYLFWLLMCADYPFKDPTSTISILKLKTIFFFFKFQTQKFFFLNSVWEKLVKYNQFGSEGLSQNLFSNQKKNSSGIC
ncbi:unnamed protein product [Lymnaea stagnalis]|uniref:Transmembrane protein n=1 Tax=Lymnaea stagnalis TaxID=6523 RepID=A0AAV2IEA2_LYMST